MTAMVWPLLAVAFGLSMDALSLGIGMGMKRLPLSHILRIGGAVGIFHVLMPLVGMTVGVIFHYAVGDVIRSAGAWVLVGLGLHMVYRSLFGGERTSERPVTGWEVWIFAASVSIDALSAGIGLGALAMPVWFTVLLFGLVSATLSVAGMLLGGRTSAWIGARAETVGGLILLCFGVRWL